MTPRVVPVTSDNAALLAHLHAASFPSPWQEEDFALFLEQAEVAGWAAGHTDTSSGFILVRFVADEAEIMTLAVDPAARGRGLGRILVTHAVEELRARGVATLHLEVAVHNMAALGLYRTLGFIACGRRKNYYQQKGTPSSDATVMRLDI